MSSRRSVEKISQTLQQYRGVLQKLFPDVHPEQLQGLPREKLINLISRTNSFQPSSPLIQGSGDRPPSVPPDLESLEQLQPPPEDNPEDCDAQYQQGSLRNVTKDVNAPSLSMKYSSSYLGISSVMAALRVILWLDPGSQAFVNELANRSGLVRKATSVPSDPSQKVTSTLSATRVQSPSAVNEISVINAYFEYMHPFIPLIEEQAFRDTYMTKQRQDARWILLLNTILAMGSIANGTSDEMLHSVYFDRIKPCLSIDNLGSAHIETVQALAILGGFYFHYTQQPTLADVLMGAALRMAIALGLHRDYAEGVVPSNTSKCHLSIDLRRRVWWSIFMLDTWASSTLGRPSMGRWSHAITARCPQEPIGGSTVMMTLIQENIRFCMISTRVEDSLAVSPLMDETERQTFDSAFLDWFESSSVQSSGFRSPWPAETPGVSVLKNVMRWRYLSSRIILHRPVLLWYAMRKMPFNELSNDKKTAIDLCRDVTTDLITDIATTWRAPKKCQMAGWNATWLIYQAVMVPLLSLFTDALDYNTVSRSQHQIERAMATLTELQQWCSMARQSLDVVSRIYEASRRHTTESQESTDYYSDMGTPAITTNIRPGYSDLQYANSTGGPEYLNTPSKQLHMSNMFDSLNWSTKWTNHDYLPVTPRLGWDRQAVNGWASTGDSDGYFCTVFSPNEQVHMNSSGGVHYDTMHGQHEVRVGHFSY